jgi:16S rRNA (uracil1498-N3)-methyltransferase
MRLHRFYTTEQLTESLVYTSQEHLHQWRNVFRYTEGDRVILFGDGFEYVYEIKELNKKAAHLEEISKKESLQRTNHLTLAIALIKKDNFELILEKCTELGVDTFIPLVTDRSLQKMYGAERLQKILIEATEQSGWGTVPRLEQAIPLRKILESPVESILFFDVEGTQDIKDVSINKENKIVVIGPEGGFTEEEIKQVKESGIHTISVGKNTLRAETAAISISSLLLF